MVLDRDLILFFIQIPKKVINKCQELSGCIRCSCRETNIRFIAILPNTLLVLLALCLFETHIAAINMLGSTIFIVSLAVQLMSIID